MYFSIHLQIFIKKKTSPLAAVSKKRDMAEADQRKRMLFLSVTGDRRSLAGAEVWR